MSPDNATRDMGRDSFPRVSGDEPVVACTDDGLI